MSEKEPLPFADEDTLEDEEYVDVATDVYLAINAGRDGEL